LLFDTTTILCSGADHSLEDFLSYGYDYIGAPWKGGDRHPELLKGGNGRLSLRNRAQMLACTTKYKYEKGNEDMWFSKFLQRLGANVSDAAVGNMFAVEELPYPAPFGVSYAMRTVPKKQRVSDRPPSPPPSLKLSSHHHCPPTPLPAIDLTTSSPHDQAEILQNCPEARMLAGPEGGRRRWL
jgi:hypothetical protein